MELQLPKVGSFVWYSFEQAPRLGQVVELDPTLPRPLTVLVYDPVDTTGSPLTTRYEPRKPESGVREESGIYDQMFLSQVRFGFESLTTEGLLRKQDRERLQRCLSR